MGHGRPFWNRRMKRHRCLPIARWRRWRLPFTLLLTLAIPLGNAVMLRPSSADWLVALCSDEDGGRPLSLRPLEPQHLLFVMKESELRLVHPTRSDSASPLSKLSRLSLQPLRLTTDWSIVVQRAAATSLLQMEVRLQV